MNTQTLPLRPDEFHAAALPGTGSLQAVGASELDRLTALLEARLDSLCAAVIARCRERATPSAASPWQEFIHDAMRAQLRDFRHGVIPNACPDHGLAATSLLSTLAEPVPLLGVFRIAHPILWQAWFELVESSSAADLAERRLLLSYGSDFLFRYADRLSDLLLEAHRRQRDQLATSTAERRFRSIGELLDGDPLAASWLDLDLERHHLGLIAWGEGASAAARALAEGLGRPLLLVSAGQAGESFWAWISGTRPLDFSQQRYLAAFQPTDARIALGLEAFGEAGFRATHRQAQRARGFARPEGPAVLRYEDYIVEALATENEEDARAFVAHELAGIDDDSPTSCRIRETLAAYFASESNAACTGAALGIHQQTVANRLRAAEQRLGHDSIGVRRVELEVALRLRACLPAQDFPAR